jgi:hypothetical protein
VALRIGSIRGIDEHGHTRGSGYQLAQELQPLRRQLNREKIDPSQVAARPSEAGDKTEFDRVVANDEYDGNRRSCRLGRQHDGATSGRDDHGDAPVHQIGGQCRQPIVLAVRETVFDRQVLALDIAGFLQPLPEGNHTVIFGLSRLGAQPPDHRQRRLLRARRERPGGRRTAKKGYELASPHGAYPKAKDRGLTIASLERVGGVRRNKKRRRVPGSDFSSNGPPPLSGDIQEAVLAAWRCVQTVPRLNAEH